MWSRPEKISFWTAFIAIIISLVPQVQRGLDWLNRQTANISAPANATIFHINHNQGAAGDAHNISINSDLWFIIRAGVEGRWYPVTQIREHDGPWHVQSGLITPALGSQEFVLVLVPVTDDAQFIDYVKQKNKTGADPGISSLPPLATIEGITKITVEN